MGLTNPVGQEFSLNGQWGRIVGVIKDTYFKDLHTKIEPQVFQLHKNMEQESSHSVLFLKIDGSDVPGTLKGIEKIWNRNNPGIQFEYSFLNEEYRMLYRSDLQIARLINVFALLAVFIACLGLFSQSTFAAENRTKEIGIRKANGAHVFDVLILLNRDFVRWIIIAFGFATPVAWFFMNKWLQNFAYKTELSYWIFALAGILALAIALFSVSWQSWKAATRNPVEALRYE
jgi:putative ABC transport system permease protein